MKRLSGELVAKNMAVIGLCVFKSIKISSSSLNQPFVNGYLDFTHLIPECDTK